MRSTLVLFLVLLQESESFFSASSLRASSSSSSPLLRRIVRSSTAEDDDSNSIPPPPPRESGGEWEDWENESYLDDPYVFEEGDSIIPTISKELLLLASSTPADIAMSVDKGEGEEESIIPSISEELLLLAASSSSSTSTVFTKSSSSWDMEKTGGASFTGSRTSSSATTDGKAAVYVKNEAEWAGWIEDAPYFDEEDSKLTKDFNYGGEKGTSSQSTNLQAKPVITGNVTPPSPKEDESETVDSSMSSSISSSSDSSSSSSSSSSDILLLLLESNRRFDRLEDKIAALTAESKDGALKVNPAYVLLFLIADYLVRSLFE